MRPFGKNHQISEDENGGAGPGMSPGEYIRSGAIPQALLGTVVVPLSLIAIVAGGVTGVLALDELRNDTWGPEWPASQEQLLASVVSSFLVAAAGVAGLTWMLLRWRAGRRHQGS